jgi:multisubunit Na+/H+ antiporter MnhB subunit
MKSVKAGVCALSIIEGSFSVPRIMLAIRIYISTLTLIFLILVIANHGLGFLQGVVITCALLFLILDVRTDLQSRKIEFRLLQDLEQRISELLR